jgi:phage baseplate assembly protein W
MDANKAVLGQGLSFPVQVNAQGGLALVTGADDIKQAIRIILGTIPGERVMRPTFGCRAWELVFAPNNTATRRLLELYVREALEFWEPRIELRSVTVIDAPAPRGTPRYEYGNVLHVLIDYEIKATHDARSIVYPFYILSEGV